MYPINKQVKFTVIKNPNTPSEMKTEKYGTLMAFGTSIATSYNASESSGIVKDDQGCLYNIKLINIQIIED